MKNLKTYIPCLILSVLLVFMLLGGSALIIGKSFSRSDKLYELTEENQIVPKIQTELENYFSDKYNETGIPSEVYTGALTDEYIQLTVNNYIGAGINQMSPETTCGFDVPENKQLEENITEFFSSYADSVGYTKDNKYEEKLEATINSAYNVIGEYCDVYKFRTMDNEGILNKAAPIYHNLDKIILCTVGASLLLLILILLINIKSVSTVLYWTGISALVSGIIGILPCIYLNATNYFDSFVIKQPHIFTSFTSLMYGAVNAFMVNQIILAVSGAVLILLFVLISAKLKKR